MNYYKKYLKYKNKYLALQQLIGGEVPLTKPVPAPVLTPTPTPAPAPVPIAATSTSEVERLKTVIIKQPHSYQFKGYVPGGTPSRERIMLQLRRRMIYLILLYNDCVNTHIKSINGSVLPSKLWIAVKNLGDSINGIRDQEYLRYPADDYHIYLDNIKRSDSIDTIIYSYNKIKFLINNVTLADHIL